MIRKGKQFVSLPALVLAATAAGASAATVTYEGFVEGTQVNEWRTTMVAKTMDPDGDNLYGTHAAVQWLRSGVSEFTPGSASPGWAYAGETGAGQFTNAGYAQVDDVLNPAATWGGGIGAVNGTFTFELTGTTATYSGKTVRVGIMADILSAPEWAADINKTIQLQQVVGGSGISPIVSLRGGGAGNGQPEMYFFDLVGVNAGDRFQVITGGNPGGQPGYIGPVSWDLYTPIPEPSAALLGSAAALGLLRRRRA